MCHHNVLVNKSDRLPLNTNNAVVSVNGIRCVASEEGWVIPAFTRMVAPWLPSLLNKVAEWGYHIEISLKVENQPIRFMDLVCGDVLCLDGVALQLRKIGECIRAIQVNNGKERIYTPVGPYARRH